MKSEYRKRHLYILRPQASPSSRYNKSINHRKNAIHWTIGMHSGYKFLLMKSAKYRTHCKLSVLKSASNCYRSNFGPIVFLDEKYKLRKLISSFKSYSSYFDAFRRLKDQTIKFKSSLFLMELLQKLVVHCF